MLTPFALSLSSNCATMCLELTFDPPYKTTFVQGKASGTVAPVQPVDDCGSYANAKQCSKKGGECEWKDDTCSSAGGEGVEIDCGSLTKKNCQKKSSGVCAWMDGMCAPSPGMTNFGANENVMGADAIEQSNSAAEMPLACATMMFLSFYYAWIWG